MKKINLAVLFTLLSIYSYSQSVIGKWKTIDDVTGEAKSIIQIYEKSGKIYGKVVDILNPANRNNLCANCKGEDKGKPLLGLLIIKGLSKNDDEYDSGEILDPKTGKLYSCIISLESNNKLKVTRHKRMSHRYRA